MPDVPTTAARLPVAVDIVALTVDGDDLMVLIAKRLVPPYRGQHCLPGGFVLDGENLTQAALRELQEETGLDATGHLEQLCTIGPLGRDPRGPVLSVAYLVLSPFVTPPRAGGDVGSAEWMPANRLPKLAFDHETILSIGIERARAKLEYSGLATAFCDSEFTIAELRRVYEAVWGVTLDARNFNRKVTTTAGFLQPVARRQGQPGRPAVLYRMASGADPASTILNPPVMRPGAAGATPTSL
ncbi:MAG: NUDIX hydrolase [Propionibacteriaceae bacterium]|nr:NUDIX hydrolase [Propionibacteriaceae bacterium]